MCHHFPVLITTQEIRARLRDATLPAHGRAFRPAFLEYIKMTSLLTFTTSYRPSLSFKLFNHSSWLLLSQPSPTRLLIPRRETPLVFQTSPTAANLSKSSPMNNTTAWASGVEWAVRSSPSSEEMLPTGPTSSIKACALDICT